VVPQIAVLHSLGIIWMDPKLENIMQFHDKYVIIDFDISMIVNLEEINQAQFLGSPGYTFSVNSITPYEDWRKFMLIIANFECSFR
jgi:serine/threonine protein kinase